MTLSTANRNRIEQTFRAHQFFRALHDPHFLGRSNRSAAGLTPANKLLLVSVPKSISLADLAGVMRGLGCSQAMNLDGGASMAMYYRGRTVLPAGRRLTNILAVYEDGG